MKKFKRIFALLGAVLLICLYGSTLVFAIADCPSSADLLKASIAATILLPVLFYTYTLVYRLSQKKKPDDTNEDD